MFPIQLCALLQLQNRRCAEPSRVPKGHHPCMRSHRRRPIACSRPLDVAHTLRLNSDDGKAKQKAGATIDPDVLGERERLQCFSQSASLITYRRRQRSNMENIKTVQNEFENLHMILLCKKGSHGVCGRGKQRSIPLPNCLESWTLKNHVQFICLLSVAVHRPELQVTAPHLHACICLCARRCGDSF